MTGRNINLLPDEIELPQKHSEPILHRVRAQKHKITMGITRQLGTCKSHPKKNNTWHIPPTHGSAINNMITKKCVCET